MFAIKAIKECIQTRGQTTKVLNGGKGVTPFPYLSKILGNITSWKVIVWLRVIG